ncbi:hypothetical protein Tco_0843327 [Tanacetum coccineum]|uniref:Uncharacterized protein n=1 Tax=Tanacetum coccineum TaxID=301880 RepID=A0ABQ5B1S5_9ASTR
MGTTVDFTWGSEFVYLGRLCPEHDELPSSVGLDFLARLDGGRIVKVTKLTTGRLVNGSSCDGIDMIEILHDVVGTSGYRYGVLRSFPVERIEQGIR